MSHDRILRGLQCFEVNNSVVSKNECNSAIFVSPLTHVTVPLRTEPMTFKKLLLQSDCLVPFSVEPMPLLDRYLVSVTVAKNQNACDPSHNILVCCSEIAVDDF